MKVTIEFDCHEINGLIREHLSREGHLKDGKMVRVSYRGEGTETVAVAEIMDQPVSYFDR